MESHVKWGLGFIFLGIAITFVSLGLHLFIATPFLTIIYSVSLILIGIALIMFGKRERKIEEVVK
jgi:multisubunit Na+/H+ antiporter MnhG subunit